MSNLDSQVNIQFQGPTKFSRNEIAAACRHWGPSLWLRPEWEIDGAQLLWAISGNESSFGSNCTPRHESSYCTGRYSTSPDVIALTTLYGHAAHASFGPWQQMLCNVVPKCDPEEFVTASFAAMKAAAFINMRIIRAQGAQTIDQIADAYNSGNWKDSNVPAKYIADVNQNYLVEMPAVGA